jgi:acyl carrier protein
MELDKQIWKYVADNLLYVDDPFGYDNDTSFIEEGLIDSTGVMELVTYVQFAFDITVEPHDVTPDNFDSVNKLVAFIHRKHAVLVQSAN